MSAPIRFLALVIVGWAGVRAVALGDIPGFTVSYAKERPASNLPPIVATQFPPLPPPGGFPALQAPPAYPAYPLLRLPPGYFYPAYTYPAGLQAASQPIPPRPAWQLPTAQASGLAFTASSPTPGDWQISRLPAFPTAHSRPIPVFPAQPRDESRLDRLQLTT